MGEDLPLVGVAIEPLPDAHPVDARERALPRLQRAGVVEPGGGVGSRREVERPLAAAREETPSQRPRRAIVGEHAVARHREDAEAGERAQGSMGRVGVERAVVGDGGGVRRPVLLQEVDDVVARHRAEERRLRDGGDAVEDRHLGGDDAVSEPEDQVPRAEDQPDGEPRRRVGEMLRRQRQLRRRGQRARGKLRRGFVGHAPDHTSTRAGGCSAFRALGDAG